MIVQELLDYNILKGVALKPKMPKRLKAKNAKVLIIMTRWTDNDLLANFWDEKRKKLELKNDK